jgi:hypothetical protein
MWFFNAVQRREKDRHCGSRESLTQVLRRMVATLELYLFFFDDTSPLSFTLVPIF